MPFASPQRSRNSPVKVKYLGKKNSSKVLDYSPYLLDSVKRSPIDSVSHYGIDYWNVYEFSYLNSQNRPALEALEIKISMDSNFTVESKSLKIYLASFYKRKFQHSINAYKLIERDLSKLTKSMVRVSRKTKYDSPPKSVELNGLLETINKNKIIKYEGFRSICPVTAQPDWANIYIHSSSHSIDSRKVIKLLKSFREKGDFHEACINSIFLTLKDDFKINDLTVYGRFLRRGGIDINPIRSSNKKMIFKNFRDFNQ